MRSKEACDWQQGSRLHLRAHEEGEEVSSLGCIIEGQAAQGPPAGVHSCAPQLLGHHLSQALCLRHCEAAYGVLPVDVMACAA